MNGVSEILAIALALLAFVVIPIRVIDQRSKRTERMLIALLNHLKLDPNALPEPSDEVKALAEDPKAKIAAIKAYRQQTGLGLLEAKEAVERLSRS